MNQDISVSVILNADQDIKSTIKELRKSVKFFDYEFIVIDKGTQERHWLSQQGDTQLITLHDNRDLQGLIHRIARYGNRIYLDDGEWKYEYKPVNIPTIIEPKEKMLLPKLPEETRILPKLPEGKMLLPKLPEEIRILHVSSFPDNTTGITEALKSFGSVETFNWLKEKNATNSEEMNEALKWAAISFRTDIIFIEECFTGDIFPDTIMHIKSLLKVGVINWCGDIRAHIPASMINMAEAVDWTLISNQPQVEQLQKMGFNAAHLHAGAPTWLYKPMTPDKERFPEDIIFLGSGGRNYPLSPLRKEMCESLYRRYGDKFAVYGRGWRKKDFPYAKPFIETKDEAIAYSSCKVAVGISAFDWDNYTSARMWKAMASGALYIPYYFNGIEKSFVHHEHLAWWKRLPELYTFIDYYLAREADREKVSKAGMKKVIMEHSWTSRIETALRLLNGRKIKVF